MSNHRIHLISLLSALALLATSAGAQPATNDQDSQYTRATHDATTQAAPHADATDRASSGSTSSVSSSATGADDRSSTGSESITTPREAQINAAGATSAPTSATDTANLSQSAGSATMNMVRPVTDESEHTTFSALKGKRIRGSDGNELGKIHDFVVDASSGKLAHVIVSTGGVLGVGDKLRSLPASQLSPGGDEHFTTQMAQSEFRELPAITEDALEAGRLASGSSEPGRAATEQLVRASDLTDKSIRSDDSKVGEIEHVVIDLVNGSALALVDVSAGFAGDSGKYLVPFSKLEVRSGEADHITSALMRSDFAREESPSATAGIASSGSNSGRSGAETAIANSPDAGTAAIAADDSSRQREGVGAGSAAVASSTSGAAAQETTARADSGERSATGDAANANATVASNPYGTTDEQLTPTGRTSAEQGPVSAMAIRQALDGDATLARENVQVSTKIILQGTVQSEEAKQRAEELARQAAGSTEVDNQISVQPK